MQKKDVKRTVEVKSFFKKGYAKYETHSITEVMDHPPKGNQRVFSKWQRVGQKQCI